MARSRISQQAPDVEQDSDPPLGSLQPEEAKNLMSYSLERGSPIAQDTGGLKGVSNEVLVSLCPRSHLGCKWKGTLAMFEKKHQFECNKYPKRRPNAELEEMLFIPCTVSPQVHCHQR